MTTPDYADWQEPQAHATAISQTGVPLLNAAALLEQALGVVIPTNGASTFGPWTITQTGYSATIGVLFPSGSPTAFVKVQLQWIDSVSNALVARETYFLPGSFSANAWVTLGSGLAKADTLKMVITNLDATGTATINITVDQDSVVRGGDRWYFDNEADNGLSTAAATSATYPPDEFCLGVWASSGVSASSQASRLFGMAPGRAVQFSYSASGPASPSGTLQAVAVPNSVYTAGAILAEFPLTSLTGSFQFIAPRGPVVLHVNNGATSTLTFTGGMFAQQLRAIRAAAGVRSTAMGTAPTEQQPFPMPDPDRLVRRSVALMQRLGMSEVDAVSMVVLIGAQVRAAADTAGPAGVQWVDAILVNAGRRLARFTPSYSEREANEHADG